MANSDHLERLRQGINVWNMWRAQESFIKADLRGMDLGRAALAKADLGGADLRGVNLNEANLEGADLRGANLRGTDLVMVNLRGADLRGADLRGADLRGADLRGADLGRADLGEANLTEANLEGADLSRADLGRAYLRGVNLNEANLEGTDLRGANLRGTTLFRVDLREADLREADLREADLRGADLGRADLGRANLNEANLNGVNLRGANLRGAKLRRANLAGADFFRTAITGADLSEAYLRGTDLSGADLSAEPPWHDESWNNEPRDGGELSADPNYPLRGFNALRGFGDWRLRRVGPAIARALGSAVRKKPMHGPSTASTPNDLIKLLRSSAASHMMTRSASPDAETVDAAVFCPPRVAKGSRFLLQVFLYQPEAKAEVTAQAKEADEAAARRGTISLQLDLSRGTHVDLHVEVCGLTIGEPDATLVWRSRPIVAQFEVSVPANTMLSEKIGHVRFAVAGLPVGTLRFKITLAAPHMATLDPEPREANVVRYRTAFASYSSEDRGEVLKRVQGAKRAGLEVFQDVLDLEPGQRWERELYRHIKDCDVFLLFWSRAAAASEWVAKEIAYALECQAGLDDNPPAIEPVPIEGPPPPEPPSVLRHLHFNDALLTHIQAAASRRP
jgi:uncharacterized protein YjbI with pentapeptide repeats